MGRLTAVFRRRSIPWALVISQISAVIGWLLALHFWITGHAPAWIDQERTFLPLAQHFFNPYQVLGFVYPPWVVVPLFPVTLVPLPLTTLVQTCLYFAVMTLVIIRYGGNLGTILIVFTSFLVVDVVIEFNIDWLVSLGLLVPPAISVPFLLSKPQVALGVLLSYKRQDLLRAGIVTVVIVLLSFLVWGAWPIAMWQAIQTYTLGRGINLAPLSHLPWPLSIAIGLLIGYVAFRRRDPALSILAWLFFVPYITLYSLFIPFCMFALRFPRIALVVSAVMWVVYGYVMLRAF